MNSYRHLSNYKHEHVNIVYLSLYMYNCLHLCLSECTCEPSLSFHFHRMLSSVTDLQTFLKQTDQVVLDTNPKLKEKVHHAVHKYSFHFKFIM